MNDLISRQAAIEALKNDMASLDHIIKGMSANDVRLDAYVSQRNQVNYDIYTINNLPPALGTNLAEVGTDCISRQAAINICRAPHMRNADCSDFEMAIMMLPPAQPTPDQNGDLWITVPDIDEVTCIYVQESKSKFCRIFYEEQEQQERIKGHWIEIALSNHTYKCSVCGRLLVNITDGKNNVAKNYPYCHCGADMREVTT